MGLISILKGTVRGARTLHAVMMAFIGYALRPDVSARSLPDALLPILSVVFLWQFTTMLNDIYDRDIDRLAHPERPLASGEIEPERYRRWAYCSLVIGLLLSLLSGFLPTVLALFYVFLSYIYSVPPARVRNRWYGTTIIGIGSGVYFSMGYWAHLWIPDMNYFHIESMTHLAFSVLLIIILSLSIAPNITAYRDYEGDVRAGVSTVYTILGPEKGKRLVALSTFLLFLLPSFLFFSWLNVIVSLIMGIFASVSFMIYECYTCVFVAYFLTLIWYLWIISSWIFS